jgi:hypothetical protein
MKRAVPIRSKSKSLSPLSRNIQGLPLELQDRVLSRLHPIDKKTLGKQYYNFLTSKFQVIRNFIINDLIQFSSQHPRCKYRIEFLNAHPDHEDSEYTIFYDHDKSPSRKAGELNIAHLSLASFQDLEMSPKTSQRSTINIITSAAYDYFERSTTIQLSFDKSSPGTTAERQALRTIVESMVSTAFPAAAFKFNSLNGGARKNRIKNNITNKQQCNGSKA